MRLKRIIIVTGISLVALVATAAVILESYDFNRFKPAIQRMVESGTGRNLVIGGDIDFDIGLTPEFTLAEIRMQNAPWGTRPDWLTIKEIRVGISLWPLLYGNLTLKHIEILQPDILIETGIDAKTNLEFGSPGEAGKRPSPPAIASVTVHEILIQNAHVAYRDVSAQRGLDLELERAAFVSDGRRSPGDLDVSGTFGSHRFEISGQTTHPVAAWRKDRPLDVNLTLRALDCDVRLEGKLENIARSARVEVRVEGAGGGMREILALADLAGLPDPGPFRLTAQVRGKIDAPAVEDLAVQIGGPQLLELEVAGSVADSAAMTGIDLVVSARGEQFSRLGQFFGREMAFSGPFDLRGRIVDRPTRGYRLEDFRFTLGPNDIAATAEVDLSGARPGVTVEAETRHFDLQPLFQTNSAPPGDDKQPAADPLIAPGLNAAKLLGMADGQLKLQAAHIDLPALTLRDLTVQAALADGRIDFDIEAPALPDLEALTGLTRMSELGSFRIAGTLDPVQGGLNLENLRFNAGRKTTVALAATGSIRDLSARPRFDLNFRLEGDDADELGKHIVEPWPLAGPFRLTGRMMADDETLFRFGDLQGRLAEIDFKGSVKVDASGQVPIVLTAVSAPRINAVPLSLPGLTLPEGIRNVSNLGPLTAEIKIAVPDGPVRFDAVRIQAGRPQLIAVSLTGRVADVEALQGVEVHVILQGEALQRIETLFGTSIPVQGRFQLDTDVKIPASGRLHFEQIKTVLGPNRLTADVVIDTQHPRPRWTAAVDVDRLDVSSFAARDGDRSSLMAYFRDTVLQDRLILPQLEVPDWLSENDAEVEIELDQFSASRVTAHDVTGRFKLQNGDLLLQAEGLAYAEVQEAADMSGAFEIGPTRLQVHGRTAQGQLALQTVRLQAGDPQTLELNLEGTVSDAIRQQGLDVRFVLKGESADTLNKFLSLHKPLEGPFRFSGHLVDPKLKEYRLEDVQLIFGDNELSGWVDMDLSPRRPRFVAELVSSRLDLRPFTGYADPAAVDASGENGAPQKSTFSPAATQPTRIFSAEPLPLNWVDRFDMHATFECRQFYSKMTALKDIMFTLKLNNGDLTLQPFRFTRGQGRADGQLTLHSRNRAKTAAVFLKITDHDVGKELADLGLAGELEGLIDVRIDVAGPAESVAAFMGQLNGRVTLYLEEGRIQEKYIGLLYSDLRSTLLKLVNPLGGRDPYIDLNCFVNTFQVQNGIANYAGVLDTPQTTLYGAGTVNLETERLDITLKSNPKRGLDVPGVGRIGFSLSDLTKPFKLGGALVRPSLAVDPAGTAFTFGKILGGLLALGPAGIAVVFADVSLDTDNPCAKALLEAQKELKKD
jgi:uncharacterized protein involved in outer membrane biogenesis